MELKVPDKVGGSSEVWAAALCDAPWPNLEVLQNAGETLQSGNSNKGLTTFFMQWVYQDSGFKIMFTIFMSMIVWLSNKYIYDAARLYSDNLPFYQ